MNTTTTMPVYTTKSVSEVPFKSELYSKDASWNLLAAVTQKSYYQFIRDCKNPDLLLEVMMLKCDQPHFPSLIRITKISRRADFWGELVSFVVGKFAGKVAGKNQGNAARCAIYRNHIPKNQYAA